MIVLLFEEISPSKKHRRREKKSDGTSDAVTQHTVELGGTIRARGTPDEAATFIIALPTLHRNPV